MVLCEKKIERKSERERERKMTHIRQASRVCLPARVQERGLTCVVVSVVSAAAMARQDPRQGEKGRQ